MPNQNAIVGRIVSFDPPFTDQNAAEFLNQYPDGVSIQLEGDQNTRLLPGDLAAGRLEILAELRKMEAPVYIEFNPENLAVTRLLIPLVTKVETVSTTQDGVTTVGFTASHARHRLAPANPDYEQYLEAIKTAKEQDRWLIVTTLDDFEILDVRLSPFEPPVPEVAAPPVAGGCLDWLCRWIKWLRFWFCCVSEQKAVQLFNMVGALTCDPLKVPSPCIPFLYPDDGCWARAHEMCRLMIAAGARPKKVWIDGRLTAPTRNHPNCQVRWGWHVAPTLCVRTGFFRSVEMVIDPSLFKTPVPKLTWKGAQGDPAATLTDTPASLYWRNYMPTDPNYIDTNQRLHYYRLQLKNRALSVGAPPYAHCP